MSTEEISYLNNVKVSNTNHINTNNSIITGLQQAIQSCNDQISQYNIEINNLQLQNNDWANSNILIDSILTKLQNQ